MTLTGLTFFSSLALGTRTPLIFPRVNNTRHHGAKEDFLRYPTREKPLSSHPTARGPMTLTAIRAVAQDRVDVPVSSLTVVLLRYLEGKTSSLCAPLHCSSAGGGGKAPRFLISVSKRQNVRPTINYSRCSAYLRPTFVAVGIFP